MEVKMYKLNPLRLARLKAGMCQHEAALKSKIPQSQISLFERDLKKPTPEQLESLSQVYRVDLSECQLQCQAAGG
jgi:transcriptional regulator with XRE-family HTH domain